jgi:hypothetical protein
MRLAVLFMTLPFVGLAASPAGAQSATAEDLFREGVSLFARGETAAACERFERSYKLDAAPGTLFNRANCYERAGRLWLARTDFKDLVDRATAAGKLDKAELARARLVAVEAQLPKVSLAFPQGSNVATIAVDGVQVDRALWQKPFPVDVGAHVIEFGGPGKATVKQPFTAGAAITARLDVPMLGPLAEAPLPVPPAAATATPSPTPETKSGDANVAAIVGYSIGGVGLVGLGIGGYFTAQAVSEHNQSNIDCHATTGGCATAADTAKAKNDASSSTSDGYAAGIAFGIGLVAVAAGVTLIATSGGHSSTPKVSQVSQIVVTPALGPRLQGLSLTGRF